MAGRLLTYDEALARLLDAATPLRVETVPLGACAGRVLAQDLRAPRDRPVAPVAAMDGYAVRAEDHARMAQGLTIAGQAYPGAGTPPPLQAGQAMRVTTGALLPAGAARVVIDENVAVAEGRVRLVATESGKTHVRATGSDVARGALLVTAGSRLTPPALMAAALAERGALPVQARPRVAILTTGDEIAAPERCADRPDLVPDSVSLGVGALARAWGGEVVRLARAGDQDQAVAARLAELAASADVAIVVGGASGSERDLGRGALAANGGTLLFAGVAIRPGKPVWAGRIGETLVIGLPGNPTAALIAAQLMLVPLLAALGGAVAPQWRRRPIADALPAGGEREAFLLAVDGPQGLTPLDAQTSAGQGGLAQVVALIRRPPHAPAEAAGAEAQTQTMTP